MRAICMLSILLGVAQVQADPGAPAAGDVAEADRLFNEGRELLGAGKRAEACAKFDESFRKDPRAVGTMLNLGLCREEAGQLASAVRLYGEARDRAHDQKLSEHEEAATRKIMLLRPRVPRIAVALPVGLGASARVLIDDIVFSPDEIDAIELDPGDHRLVVTAPGKLPYETKLTLAESQHPTIQIPPLTGATTVVVASTNRRALWGKIATVGGVVIAGAGLGVALLARSQYWDQFPAGSRDGTAVMDASHDCWTSVVGGRIVRECNARGREATQSARTLSRVGLVTILTGSAIAVSGAVLWATAPHSEPTPAISLDVGRGHAGLALSGSF